MPNTLTYVLITAARNEAEYIELTIKSVIAQTIRPSKWIIVSDGSTDGTDEIVKRYSAAYSWIELIRMPERPERNFAGKVYAFNAGYERVKDLHFDALACVDGDASFEESHFEFLLDKLSEDPKLGLAGTAFREASSQHYNYRFVSIEHVTGICQLFRRQCFDEIGGYVPSKGGAIDLIANIAVRMKGWKSRTFPEKTYFHHRTMGTAQQSLLMARFKDGVKDYAVGSHPIFELFRTAYQMTRKPLIIGGMALFWGYIWSALHRVARPISREMVAFHRHEQLQRLREFLLGKTLIRMRQN